MTDTQRFVFSLAAVVLPLLVLAIAFAWYFSGVQAEVWTRQGAPMTQWEVFMGAKPIVRMMTGQP